jgi:P-type Cu2+ transporter
MTTQPTQPLSPPSDLPSVRSDVPDWLEASTTLDEETVDVASSACLRSTFRVGGIHCVACAQLIESELTALAGIRSVQVNAAAARAMVVWDPAVGGADRWLDALKRSGYSALPDQGVDAKQARRSESRQVLWRFFVASFLAMQIMMLATPAYVATDGSLSPDLRQLLNAASWLLTWPVLIFCGSPFFKGAWRSLRVGRLGMDVPVVLGLGVGFFVSTLATFDPSGPWGHEVWFDSVTMFLSFLWFARWMETRMRHRAEEALASTARDLPSRVQVLDTAGAWQTVAVSDVAVGQTVRIGAGETVPLDGTVVDQAATVSESLVTGEPRWQVRERGDWVLAGARNGERLLTLLARRIGRDTQHARLVALTRAALSQRPQALRVADRWAGPFLALVLALAAMGGLYWWWVDPSQWLKVTVAVLVVTCPCALTLAVPSTLVAAAAGLARQGVHLRQLSALERFEHLDTVLLDKTGTLTEPVAHLAGPNFVPAQSEGAPDSPVLEEGVCWTWAQALASTSSHPISRALMQAAARAGVPPPSPIRWGSCEELSGLGVQARDPAGRVWRWGRPTWVGNSTEAAEDSTGRGAQVALGVDGRLLASWRWTDVAKPGALDLVQGLKARGLRVCLATGDAGVHVDELARQLGIDEVRQGLLPQDKRALLQDLQAQGHRVLMVGDGLNDGPVLGAAEVSIVLGQDVAAVQDVADAVIPSGDPMAIQGLWTVADRTRQVMRQNLYWALAYNLIALPWALSSWLMPWLAGLGMALSSLLVVFNAQRAGRSP